MPNTASTSETLIYVGIRKSDGSMRATCRDDESCEEQTAEIVAGWIKRGLYVERITDAQYRERIAPPTSNGGEANG